MTSDETASTLTAGMEHHRAGRHIQAEQLYRQIVEQHPNHPDALHLLGVLAGERGEFDASIDFINRAIAACPSADVLHASLGETYRRMGDLQLAEASVRKAMELNPANADAHNSLGLILQTRGMDQDAEAAFSQALKYRPDDVGILNNLALLLAGMKKYEQAVTFCRRSLKLNPNQPYILSNLAGCLNSMGQISESMDMCHKAIALNPRMAEPHNNLGVCLCRLGQYNEAIALFQRAVELKPDLEDAHSHLGTCYSLTGDLSRGFVEHEWRLKGTKWGIASAITQPRWDGTDLGGKTILLHAEQGFGDIIQAARYVPLVAARHGRIILNCYPELVRVFEGFPNVQQVVPVGAHAPPFDVYCPLMSLPLVFGTTLLTIPAYVPYLHVKPEFAESWRRRLGEPDGKLRVGLAWAGRPEHENDRFRSLRLDQLASLAELSGVKYYSLQKGPAGAQISHSAFAGRITDWTGELKDMADTAALVANLDLVIAVDTSVAHLAGAMAKPVWVLLSEPPDWRWMLKRTDSPWYPTMRLFRQKRADDWGSAIAELREALVAREKTLAERECTGQRRAPIV